MNTRSLAQAVAFSSGIMTAVSAYAQPNCGTFDCLYDPRGVAIGVVTIPNTVEIRYGGKPYWLYTDGIAGISVDAVWLFKSTDCGKSAHDAPYSYWYWSATGLPAMAQSDGKDIWTAETDLQWIGVHSYQGFWDYINQKWVPDGICYRQDFEAVAATPKHLAAAPASWMPHFNTTTSDGYTLYVPNGNFTVK